MPQRRDSNSTFATSAFLIATTAIHIGVIVGIALGMFAFFWVKSNR